MKFYFTLFLIYLLHRKQAYANHYRGVVSTSEWLDNDFFYFKAQFYYRLKDNGAGGFIACNDKMIENKERTSDTSDVSLTISKCNQFAICGVPLFYLENSFICNSYSNEEDWAIVDKFEKSDIKSYNILEGDSLVAKLYTKIGEWSDISISYAWSHFSRKVKNKNGRWNHPPNTKTFPKYNLIKGCETKLKIPIDDVDGDTIRCRPSLRSAGECVLCDFSPAFLEQETCTIIFPENVTKNLIIEIQIEDFLNQSDIKPMSSVPLQFMTTLTTRDNQNCDGYPIFMPMVPPHDSCIAISEKTHYTNRFEFNSTSNITDVFLNTFEDFKKGSLTYDPYSRLWFYNYTINTLSSNVKQESLTVYAKNVKGYSSELRKLQYVLNYEPPSIISVSPQGDLCQITTGTYNWKFITNRNVSSPKKSSYINFMRHVNNNSLTLAYRFNMLTLNKENFDSFIVAVPVSALNLNENFSILIEFGAIITLDYCKPQSVAVEDLKKYQFRIIGDLSNEIEFVKLPPQYTNGLVLKLEWKFLSNGKKVECLIEYEKTGFFSVACNETSLKLLNQPSGQYNFQIRYSTKCSPSLTSMQTNWIVVNDKPLLEVTTLSLINGHASNSFTVFINCTHILPCNILCRFSTKAEIDFKKFENCFSVFKPKNQLIHLEYYVFEVFAKDEVENKANTIKIEFVADTKPPYFINATVELELYCESLHSNAKLFVADDTDYNPSLHYTDVYNTACLLNRIWTTKDYLNNTATLTQKIKIVSHATLSYTDTISIPCITNQQVLQDLKFYKGFITLENNFCNQTLDITPAISSFPSDDCDFIFNVRWIVRDTCLISYPNVIQKVFVGVRETPYSPLHMQKDIRPYGIFFKWPLDRSSGLNEVYLRSYKQEKSTLIASIISNYLIYQPRLDEDTDYYWNVIYYNSKNASLKRLSPFWEFKTKFLGNLALDTVRTPNEVIVGNKIQVTWTVKNVGNATTSSSLWYDGVYGSSLDEFNTAKLIGYVLQNRFVEPNGQYTAHHSFEIDERYSSKYFYVFVTIDYTNLLEDSENSNNFLRLPNSVKILQVPLPNLTPKQIILNPDVAKAGEDIEIKIKVENNGDGDTKLNSGWTDSININLINAENVYSATIKMAGVVKKKYTYTIIKSIKLPMIYYGNAVITCQLNIQDTLYEVSLSDNLISRNLTIIPPDTPHLIFESYTKNLTAKTDERVVVEYSVRNDGIASTVEYKWTDFLRIVSASTNEVLLSKQLDIYEMLKPGDNYTRQVEFYIDAKFNSGNYQILISVDYLKNVFSIFTSVNTIELPLTVKLIKSKWSLNNFDTNIFVLSRDREAVNVLEVKYTTKIEYPFKTASELVWTDEYYLTDQGNFYENFAFKVGESNQRLSTTTAKIYQISVKKTFYLENLVYGKYYLYIFIDKNQLVDKVIEFNYPIEKFIQIYKILPLLKISNFRLLKDLQSFSYGYSITVAWKFENIGKVRVENPQFKFYVVLSDSSFHLGAYQSQNTLYPKDFKEESTQLTLSLQLYGTFRIIISSGYNTMEESISVTIQQPPSADLSVIDLIYGVSLGIKENNECNTNRVTVNVTYTVENIAYSMDKLKTWTDKISVVCDNDLTVVSKSLRITKQLWSSDTYTNSYQFLFSLQYDYYKKCKVTVYANADKGAFELFSLVNNLKEQCCFSVPRKPDAIFTLKLFNYSNEQKFWKAGDAIDIVYTIKNEGNSSKYSSNTWKDSVYLHRQQADSQNNILNNGIFVGEKAFYDFELACNESSLSNYTIKVQLPISTSGKYFMYLVHDSQGINADPFRLFSSNFDVNIIPIEPCDVASTNGTIASAGNVFTGGNKINFFFEIYNLGKGRARGGWYDAVYLSKFPIVTSKDIRLITIPRQRELYTNEFYKVVFELKLPLKLSSGQYFLVFVADTANVLPDLNRDNNQASIMIQIEAITGADIFVSNVTVNSNVNKSLQFSWQLNADQELKAEKCDSMYLSFDKFFSYISDFELDTGYCEAFEIKVVKDNRLSNINYIKDIPKVPLLPDGSYYGIVRTITNVQETNLENNAGVSNQSITIEVQDLHINLMQEILIMPNQNNLFKFKPDLNMNALKVELKTNFQQSYNDIFIQLNRIPTENSFVSKSRFAYSFNQTSIIRNAKSDKYYMIVKSYLASTDQPYKASLLIKDVQEIDIDLFEPTKLSVNGKNTIKITGNFAPQKLEICLTKKDDINFLTCAVKVYKVSIEIVFATFDLSNSNLQPENTYKLTVNNKSANQVIEAIKGVVGNMQLNLEISRQIYRPNETAYVDLIVNNNGDTDIYVPVIFVSTIDLENTYSTPGAKKQQSNKKHQRYKIATKIKPDYAIVSINNKPYPPYFYDYLIALNTNNLGGVIQPRSSAMLRLKVRPTSSEFVGISMITAVPYEDSFFPEYIRANIASYKPRFYTDKVWKHLSKLLISKVSQNSKEILYETVNELASNGVEFYRLSDLVVYHISRLDGAFFSNNLIDSVDFDIIENEVAYVRSYSAKFSVRNTRNIPLGMGWTDNLHIKLEKNSDYDSLLLTSGGKQYSIDFRTSNTSYFSDVWQIDISGNTAIITLKEKNLVYKYDFIENCIRSIATVTGNKFMTVNCHNSKIYEIFNTELSIKFTYTTNNLLQTITKASSISPKETFAFIYDSSDCLIEFTTPSVTIKYEYDSQNNLVKATTSANLIFKYEFNKDNLVSRITNYMNNQTILDYNYMYYDYGPIEMLDQIDGWKVKFFYDLNGRLLYYEKNNHRRVNFISSMDLRKSTILVNGEIVKKIEIDDKLNSVNQIFGDESSSSNRIVFKNETYEVIEYGDRLNNKVKLIRQLVNNNFQIEELLLPNNLKERKIFDLKKNVLQIFTRNNDELILKYDENLNRVFYSHATGDVLNSCSFEYTQQGYLSAARAQDDYYSVYNSYDAFGRLTKTQLKSDFIIEYSYNSQSNLVEMKTNQNMNFKYIRDQNERVTQLQVNGDTLVLMNYTRNGFRLSLTKVSRYFDYLYSGKNGQLIRYVVGDMEDEKNSVRYEYEYNNKNLMKTLKLFTGDNKDNYVSKYAYDSLDRLVSVKNERLNATVNVLYDSNGNRIRYHESIGFGNQQTKDNEYVINQMNQYLSDGINFYTYDLNGNVIQESDKSQTTIKTYNYFKDGKLSQFINKDDNCSLKYDCLERLSQLNCTKTGLFIFSYQYYNQNPLSLRLSNKTVIYFLYLPGINSAIGFIMNNKVHYFEYNGHFIVQKLLVNGTVIMPPEAIPNLNPFILPTMTIITGLPINLNTLQPSIDLNTILSSNNKPLLTTHNAVFGQSVFNIDSILNQNLLFTEATTKLLSNSNPFFNNLESLNSIKPPSLNPSFFQNFLPSKPTNPLKLFNYPTSQIIFQPFKSSFCDKYNSFMGYGKRSLNKKKKQFISTIYGFLADEACEAAGIFIKEFFFKKNTFKDSIVEVIKNNKFNIFVDISCNGITWPSLDKLLIASADKLSGKYIESKIDKIPIIPECVKILINSVLPTLSEFIKWLFSLDPNEIIGPPGYGAFNYVSNDQTFTFVVNFENMANASAPAQLVEVTSLLDEHFNYASLSFTRYGFNSFEKTLDYLKRPYLTEILELERFNLRVFATIDSFSRKIIWQFKTIDKATGDIPDDASFGFLPPSNGTHGKGFIEFTVLLRPNLHHLTTVKASASIVFDKNDAIETNILVYTIDAMLPEISLSYKPHCNCILLNATDKGSGINRIVIYNGTEKIIFSTEETTSSFELSPNDQSYTIYYAVQDNVMNNIPLTFFESINITLHEGSNERCSTNCSNNGVCVKSFCQCSEGFKGDNCDVKITINDLLNEPPSVDIGYLPMNIRGLLQLMIKANEPNPTSMQIKNIPENVLIKYKNQTVTSVNLITLNNQNTTSLTVQSQLVNETSFNIEANITTTRFNNLTNHTVTVSTVLYYPIIINMFEIEYKFQLKVNCYNKKWKNNSVELFSEQVGDMDVVSLESFKKPSFMELNLVKLSVKSYRLDVNWKDENFDDVEITLNIQVNSTITEGKHKTSIVESTIESYKMCKDSISPVVPPEKKRGLTKSTIVVIGVIPLVLIIVVIAIVSIVKNRKIKESKKQKCKPNCPKPRAYENILFKEFNN
ncbi:uncharacterized protein LOC105847832 [Hydra vulgaris]|uniref:uncharacterized protein LOC105847832 n=1 Tax=Hydra vulgaris TaxID=6087 RepID=UPI001F5FC0CB|nr:uncharacterized protein LOC105847832 [Hydra vulgaris]